MRLASALSAGQVRRGPLLLFGTLILGAFAAYELAQYVINDDMTGLAYAALCVGGGSIAIAILNNWRNGVYFFLAWLLFEDFARKFLGNNMAIYFAKDALLLVVYIAFFAAYRRKETTFARPPFLVPVLLFVWFGFMQIFNPGSPHIMFGLMGFKMFFYYVPLLFVGYALLNSEAELRRFFIINLVLAVVVISLGIVQSIVGASFLNPAVQAEDLQLLSNLYRVSPITGAVAYRPTSVFVSASRYSDFIMVAWILVLGFSGYLLLRHKQGRILAFIAIPVTAAGGFLTASRGSFAWLVINSLVTSVAFIWGAPWRQREVIRVLRSIQRLLLGIVLGLVVLFVAYPDALTSRFAIYEETMNPSRSTNELAHRGWTYPLENFMGAFANDRWPYGFGIGTSSNGTQYVSRIFGVKPHGVAVESGFGTLVVEMGIGGLILWLVMSVTILGSAWSVAKKLKGSPWYPLAFVIFWYAFFLLVPATWGGMAAYEDFLLNAYFWLLLGLLLRLPTLALSTQFALDAPATAPARPQRWMR